MKAKTLKVKSENDLERQVIDRIESIRNQNGLSQREFIERLTKHGGAGLEQVGYSNMLTRGTRPPIQLVDAVRREFGFSAHWLLTGEGSPRLDLQGTQPEAPPGLLLLPLYGAKAAAGEPHIALSEEPVKLLAFREDWIRGELRRNPADLFLVTVIGDSMYPTLVPGEIVLVDRTETVPHADAIYLMRVGEGIMVKRLQWGIDKQLHIISDNAAYRERTITSTDLADGVAVLGRVIWGGRRY